MRQSKSCGFLIVRGQPIDTFLLMRHADRLDLPKGHVDRGESDLACALRELEEETGISADAIEVDPDFRFVSQYLVGRGEQTSQKTLVIFLGRLLREVDIEVTEHLGFEWVAWSPPHSIQTRTIDPLLAELASHLQGSRSGMR